MPRPTRPGRLPRWQRWSTYLALCACAITGLVWFVMIDAYDLPPTATQPWWIGHGITAALSTLCIGGAVAQHVLVNWRRSRARAFGATNLALLTLLIATSFYLSYGGGNGRDVVHWIHVGAGLCAVAVFIGHVVWGRMTAR